MAASLPKSFTGQGLACRRGERRVFSKLDFELPAGGALLIAGPNGSGKTSLLRLMAGLARPEQGELRWNGESVAKDPAAHRARLHFIGHRPAVKPMLTVEENLGFWARMHGGEESGAVAALRRSRLDTRDSWPCRYLSAGETQRLALARLVASRAELWLLDEPASNLDAAASSDLLAAIAEHRREGGRVAVATHAELDLPGAARLSLAKYAAWREG
jgi:heme exporter protein A